jgi:hypothetical protein
LVSLRQREAQRLLWQLFFGRMLRVETGRAEVDGAETFVDTGRRLVTFRTRSPARLTLLVRASHAFGLLSFSILVEARSNVTSVPPSSDWTPALDGGKAAIRGSHSLHDLQQRAQIGSFFKESIGGNPGWYIVAGKRTAHGNHVDGGKPTTDYREEFEARHTRHVEGGENDVWDFLPDLEQCGKNRPQQIAHYVQTP